VIVIRKISARGSLSVWQRGAVLNSSRKGEGNAITTLGLVKIKVNNIFLAVNGDRVNHDLEFTRFQNVAIDK
jgi:hypothetical protein